VVDPGLGHGSSAPAFLDGEADGSEEYYTEALKWYLSAIPRYRWLEQPTQEGIERCVKRGAAVNSTLIEGLRSPDAKERALFVVAAGMMGEKARPMLGRIVDAAKESDAKVRAKALEALPKLGASDGEVLPILLSSLSDADNDVRSAAQEAVVSFKGRAVPGLIQMLSSPGAANRQDAAYLLGKIGAPDASIAAPAVVTALKDADQDVRFRMLVTLKSIGGDAKVVVPALIEVMKSDKELRYLAAQALGQYGSVAKDAVGALTDALLETIQPDNRQSSISFVWALGQIGPDAAPAVETLIDATKTFEAELAGQAALALANIGTANKRALPPLIEAFKKEARQYQEPFCEAFVMMAEAAETQNDTSMLEVLGEAHRVMYQAEGVKIEYLERMRMAIQSLKAKSATAPAKSGG
jgi:HEAT repeat protein